MIKSKYIVISLFVALSIGVVEISKTMIVKKVEASNELFEGYSYVESIARKSVYLFQLGEEGGYKRAIKELDGYLSESMEQQYFGKELEGSGEKSKITFKDISVSDKGKGAYKVKIKFYQEGGTIARDRIIYVNIDKGVITGVETLI